MLLSIGGAVEEGIYKVFRGMQGEEVIAVDIFIAGTTAEDYDQLLRNVIQREGKQNLKINPKEFGFIT